MALQKHLDDLQDSPLSRKIAALRGIDLINKDRDDNTLRAAHASSAYLLDDELTSKSLDYSPQRFGEVILKGAVPRVSCIDISERLIIALPFIDAVVLGPVIELEPEYVEFELGIYSAVLPIGVPLERPLYTPVEDILAIFAA